MQELRDYVSVICGLLQDKAPFIEELEYQMQKLHKERTEAILERRLADSNDELMELEASMNATMAVLNNGGMVDSAETLRATPSMIDYHVLQAIDRYPILQIARFLVFVSMGIRRNR
ncbi:hypothetical protein L2E82_45961 [Cichorium intybus]|uniref:Uncharacterized protein n=1 Tax=Cichorium intybus TaxID=13427 RepID=A0ACB8ZUS1_CICIN|nr:hypothetical protein L2E82_45961 [Cichorium intybus]